LTARPANDLKLRITTGIILSVLTSGTIFSNTNFFTILLALASLISQTEFSAILQKLNIETHLPFQRLATIALYFMAPTSVDVFPIIVSALCSYILVSNKNLPKVQELSASLLGVTLATYLPSFWVRLHALSIPHGLIPMDNLVSKVTSILHTILPTLLHPYMTITPSSLILLWTWTSIAISDIVAYFTGRAFGYHKLSVLSGTFGQASPKKSIQGLLGGILGCTGASVYGAHLLGLPLIGGAAYGAILGLIAFFSDLTISLLKRDAGVKDTGTLLPGHGGVLDRIDSYLLTAPLVFSFWKYYLLPRLFASVSGSSLPV
jgi:phosphatidate cytidylyltransferase